MGVTGAPSSSQVHHPMGSVANSSSNLHTNGHSSQTQSAVGVGRVSTPGPKPGPIQIPMGEDGRAGSTPSPRAALVAGLRSATDRRREERERERETLLGQMSPPGSPSPYAPQHQPSVESRMDSRMYAALQAKQQELLATSLLISQQQQRLQQAMTNASYGYDGVDAMTGSMSHLGLKNVPSQYGPYGSPYASQQAYSPVPPYGGQSPYSYHHQQQQQYQPPPQYPYSQSLFGSSPRQDWPYDLASPSPSASFLRPSSPSLPVRPRSSASGRGNSMFFPTGDNGPASGLSGAGAASATGMSSASNSNTGSNGAPPAFKRGHRKASSLSSSVTADPSRGMSPLFQPRGTVQSGSRIGNGEYQLPIRQPIGPPPLDELKAHPAKNFATPNNSIVNH